MHGGVEEAGFRGIDVRASTVRFTEQDLDGAWAAHERVYRDQLKAALGDLRAFEREYRTAVETRGDHLAVARVLHAIGIKG